MKARIWTYPWDIVDEDPDVALKRLADAGFDEISVASVYHSAMFLLPHNPKRKVYFPEGGVAYFKPDEKFYRNTPIKPIPSSLTEHGDPLSVICNAARSYDLDTVAWTVTLHNDRLGMRYPECTIENAFGDHYPYALCPSQPHVRRYVQGLVADLSSRYPLAAVEIEALYYIGYQHFWPNPKEGIHRTPLRTLLLSLCFCPACLSAAADAGLDGARVRRDVQARLNAEFEQPANVAASAADVMSMEEMERLVPGTSEYLTMRVSIVTELLSSVAAASQVPLHAIIDNDVSTRPWASGVSLEEWNDLCDGLIFTCYQEDPADIEREMTNARRRAQGSVLYAGLQAMPPQVTRPDDLTRAISAVSRAGSDGVSIYNYGLMPLSHVYWVKNALEGGHIRRSKAAEGRR
jgi:hypothetical protein